MLLVTGVAAAQGAASPLTPPDLPAGADRVPPLTLDVTVQRRPRQGPVSTLRQTIARTADRAHIRAGGQEWLFERNPLDPRRVSGSLVDHATRHIVTHEESDLRNRLGIRGWADVLMLGFDARVLPALKPQAVWRGLGQTRFQKLASGDVAAGTAEVWWNAELLLPAIFVVRDAAGSTTLTLRRVQPGVDRAVVYAQPSSRFANYKVVDLPEWLEGR